MTTTDVPYWLVGADAMDAVPFPVSRLRADFPALRRTVRGHPLVWLDNGATTHKPRQVIDAVSAYYRHHNSNVHRGAHTLAREATELYESARDTVRRFLGAERPEEIVFVRGATEAINLVAQTYGRDIMSRDAEILALTYEHHSNIVPWHRLCAESGGRLRAIPVDDRGEPDLDAYDRMLGARTRLVCLAHVSNVLGTVTPLHPMIRMAHARGVPVLVDGAQAVGHLPVDVRALDADFYVLSGHKVFAPTGIGALYARHRMLARMPPWQGGGNMIRDVTFERVEYAPPPQTFEAGTGHIAGAVGLAAALDYLSGAGREAVQGYETALMAYAERRLASCPAVRLLGAPEQRAGALAFTLDGHRPADVAAALDRHGIAVRAGHHCAQPALRRFGLEEAVRISLALYNTRADIDAAVAVLARLR